MSGPGWSAEEATAFHEAFTAHGQDFEQIASACGKSADECEALYRRQHAYLSIPSALQSTPAFAAMVVAAQKDEPVKEEPPASQQRSRSLAPGEDGGEASGAAGSRRHGSSGEEEEGEEDEEPGLAAGRARRTPKRGGLLSPGGRAAGRRTPVSGAKRGRAAAEDIYEYYDDDGDRAAARGLDFGGRGGRRRQDTDEAKGIDALLALAVAGEESLGDAVDSEEEGAPARKKAARRTPQRRRHVAADEDESEEEPADAGAMYDQADEDFAPRQRRTPYSTPAKGRLPRPGSAHATPRRSGSRGGPHGVLAGPSPGLGLRGLSPYMLGSGLEGGDMMDLGFGDLGYIASPGFQQFAHGFVPSPQNPMPRLRRRKSLPERVPAAVASPIKTLFTRRSSLAGGPALMSSFGFPAAAGGEEGGAAAAAAGGAPPPQTAAEAALRHCLQQPKTQRWAAAEFCCSALDRPFFMFNPLAGLLTTLGLGEDAQLTRKEWSLLRASLGKPRRLSLKFLKEERARLEHWREGCRQQYQSGAAALADSKVADHLPRPLAVGQRVVARHPTTRQLHDGQVLTAAHNCYRVQFDRQELGVELVRDTDVMPAEPAENLPPALLRGRLLLNGRQVINGQPVRPFAPRLPLPTPGLPPVLAAAAAAAATPLTAVPAVLPPGSAQPDSAGGAAAAGAAGAAGQQQAGQQQQQSQAKAADAKALAELVVGLDKKEALLLQLRSMNDEAAAGMHADPAAPGRGAAPQFVTAYANVVLQLKDVNEKVQEQLESLDRPSSSGEPAGGTGAAPAPQAGASLAADVVLQAQTPEALSESALAEARAIIATCRRKLAESAAEAGSPQPDAAAGAAGTAGPAAAAAAGVAPDDAAAGTSGSQGGRASPGGSQQPDFWATTDGQRLGALIEGCVHSLVLLQQGAANTALPPAALTAALDGALAAVRPRSATNQALFEEIQEAMKGLKLQIAS